MVGFIVVILWKLDVTVINMNGPNVEGHVLDFPVVLPYATCLKFQPVMGERLSYYSFRGL